MVNAGVDRDTPDTGNQVVPMLSGELEGHSFQLAGDRAAPSEPLVGANVETPAEGRGTKPPRFKPNDRVAGEFCLQTRQNLLEEGLLNRISDDFEEMLSPLGGKFTE